MLNTLIGNLAHHWNDPLMVILQENSRLLKELNVAYAEVSIINLIKSLTVHFHSPLAAFLT